MFTSRFNEANVKKRYEEEYTKYDQFIIGVDFDNTVQYLDGVICPDIITLLQNLSKLPKICLCLWSICRTPEDLQRKLDFCKSHNINISYVNESPIKYGENKKAYFNALLDDRAGLESMYNCLTHLVVYANNQLNQSCSK